MNLSKHLSKKLFPFLAFALLVLPFGQIAAEAASYQEASVPAEAITDNSTADPHIVPGEIVVKYKNGIASSTSGISIQSIASMDRLGVKKIVLNQNQNVFAAIANLKQDPNVEYAEPVYKYNIAGDTGANGSGSSVTQSVYNPDDPYYQSHDERGLEDMHMSSAWDKVTMAERQGVVIAIVDTGVRTTHEDLAANIVSGYDFVNNDALPDDDNGHGTHVAGIAAAISDNSKGIAGTAGGVKIMPVKVMDANGAGTSDVIALGIIYAADHGADVINMSLGGGDSNVIHTAVNYALDKGVVVVAAVGNDSNHYGAGAPGDLGPAEPADNAHIYYSPVNFPAAYPGVISVGAVDDWGAGYMIADFSNIGSEVDVVAPGVDILSTYNTGDQAYQLESGTSMSTPMVSGLAALILAADPHLKQLHDIEKPEEVQRILEESAMDLGTTGRDPYYGAGLVQGDRAFIDRIKTSWSTDPQNPDNLVIDLSINDYQGNVVDSVYDAYTTKVNLDRYDFNQSNWLSLGSSVVAKDVNGARSKTYANLEPGLYRITADDDGQSGPLVYSQIYLTNTPKIPMASLPSGTYQGAQSVSLASSSSGAAIYYTLNGAVPTQQSNLYVNPLSISANTTLNAIAYRNGIASPTSTYTYTIASPAPVMGGGGFFPAIPEQIDIEKTSTASGDGSLNLNVNVPENYLENKLDGGEELEIDATSDNKAGLVTIEIPVSSLWKAGNAGKSVIVNTNQAAVELSAGFLPNDGQDTAVQLIVNFANDHTVDSGSKIVSPVFDFGLKLGDRSIHQFSGKITITLSFDPTIVSDPSKLGVYYFNETSKEWEYVGGRVSGNGKIVFETTHFSKYAVLEFQPGFTDIDGHWAQKDIEAMAAKQIAKGLTDGTFAPNRQITRAEFAAWIVRALDLPNVEVPVSFTDTKADAWYNDAVYRAYGAGIIKGNSETTFGPSLFITRQEMAVMLMNAYAYATGKKIDDLFTTAEVKFADEDAASQWARRYVRLASATGLMTGNPDGMFIPKGQATRAEAISVIKRLLD